MTLQQWLDANHCHVTELLRDDLRWLLTAHCNDPGRVPYVIVERKTRAFPSYKLRRAPVHGFGRDKWKAWQQANRHVWLVVAETLEGELLALRIDGQPYDDDYDGDVKGVDRAGMVYLRKSRFAKLAQLDSAAPNRPQQLAFNTRPDTSQRCTVCGKPNSPFGFGPPLTPTTVWACRDHRAQVDHQLTSQKANP